MATQPAPDDRPPDPYDVLQNRVHAYGPMPTDWNAAGIQDELDLPGAPNPTLEDKDGNGVPDSQQDDNSAEITKILNDGQRRANENLARIFGSPAYCDIRPVAKVCGISGVCLM